jgi:hypothetical protein
MRMSASAALLGSGPDPQDFSAEPDRSRLSKVALKAYRRLVQRWGLGSG